MPGGFSIIFWVLCCLMLGLLIWGIIYATKKEGDVKEVNNGGYGLIGVGVFGCLLLSSVLATLQTSCY
ncbi:MAG: hypothetical protein Hyperionvirus45_3 [Hyperionvirus sp.]|uniref:Uncharacterized protein n=1 Tax=Hyperionvirus sp. TaxID=2487770 RepID=A0A3G5AE22_9VIRU|nr:MAG: hypothetical protein Hyperionvirus45_3 [Hyperionvirus sp.]